MFKRLGTRRGEEVFEELMNSKSLFRTRKSAESLTSTIGKTDLVPRDGGDGPIRVTRKL